MTKNLFAMYPSSATIEISLGDKIQASFDCQKCNAEVHLTESSDIAYLAREEPGLYATLAARDGGLQGYVELRR